MNQQTAIKGETITLRPIQMADTPLIVQWRNNAEVRKNFIFRETFTREMHIHWMNTKVASGDVIQYIIEEDESGKPVGSVYLRDVDRQNESAEFGIFIGRDIARGKGIGKEATQLFTQYAMDKWGFHRIFLRVLSQNETALRCYARAGFQVEGIFHDMVKLNGEFCDVIFMATIGKRG